MKFRSSLTRTFSALGLAAAEANTTPSLTFLLRRAYLGKSAWTSIYGAGSSLVILVVWVYYSSIIVYFSVEFTKVYPELRGSRKAGSILTVLNSTNRGEKPHAASHEDVEQPAAH